MRGLAREAAALWYERREELGFPLLSSKGASQEGPDTRGESSSAGKASSWKDINGKVTFALEIGTEELPSDAVDVAIAQLERYMLEALKESRLSFGEVKMAATPRRLIVMVKDLESQQEDTVTEVKGPPKRIGVDESGALTKAALGFCKKNGVDPSAIEWRDLNGQEYLFASVESKGRHAGDILSEVIPSVISKIGFIKTMRWNDSGFAFSRPIRWLVALLGTEVIDAEIAGIRADRITRGLRGAGGVTAERSVESADELMEALREYSILPELEERRTIVKKMAVDAASSVGGEIPEAYLDEGDGSLLDEVTNLVEAPKAILGRFDESFLSLPTAVLTTVMKKHQRYFPVLKVGSEELINAFITISNGPTDDETVRIGNEAVLRARYADASFFYEKDTERNLLDFKPSLSGLIFQEKLGSMLDKNHRVEEVTREIGEMIEADPSEISIAQRAAELFKADLATNMVVEFTSLAGEMGRHYAQVGGESKEVAEAIFESILPRSFTDRLPKSLAGCTVAIADRLDSLVGLFSAGCAPTANADVFALRRTAVGLVAILMKRQLPLNLRDGVEAVSKVQPIPVPEDTKEAVVDFVIKRLESSLLERGLRVDLVRAVISEQGHVPSKVESALRELVELSESESFAMALEVYGRPSRLIKSKGDMIRSDQVDETLFESEIESNLYAAYQAAEKMIQDGGENVSSVIDALATMREPVDAFFENVFVMADDEHIRQNRLALCVKIASLPHGILDLSHIQ